MGNKQPNWSRLERERFRRDMELYESQLRDDDEDYESEDWEASERPINRPSELGM